LLAGFIVLGGVPTAAIAIVQGVGVAMVASGRAEIVHGVATRLWKKLFPWVPLGAFYLIDGKAVFESPLLAASFLTLMPSAALAPSGMPRVIPAFHPPKDVPRIFLAGPAR
jgi:uncharacterized membrane protein HdeD (DUF308 family)